MKDERSKISGLGREDISGGGGRTMGGAGEGVSRPERVRVDNNNNNNDDDDDGKGSYAVEVSSSD